METHKIVNLLNDSNNESSKFATRKWNIINDQNNREYGEDSAIKFETKIIKSNLCDYSDAYILVTRNTKFAAAAADTNVAFKNFAPFSRCVTLELCINLKGMNLQLIMLEILSMLLKTIQHLLNAKLVFYENQLFLVVLIMLIDQ